MSRKILALVPCVLLALPMVGAGADVSGSLLYDDLPVATVFPDITVTLAYANPWDPGDQIEGTVDLATSTYTISGLAEGRYGIDIYLDREGSPSFVGDAGDLQAYMNIEITDPQGSFEQDLAIRYNYRVLSPIDSDLPLAGSGQDCTGVPVVDYPITFTIEPVPRAVDYQFRAALLACPGGTAVGWIDFHSAAPSGLIEWGSAGEDYQQPYVLCTGASGADLCHEPVFRYSDASVWGLFLRSSEAGGRGIHRTDAVVIPAVAGTPGAQGTYWTSAVSVVNLVDSERQIEVLFTPRGVDGLTNFTSAAVTLPASSQVAWSDVMAELFSATGAGALEVRGQQLAVTSRTSTPGAEAGSYGQGIPPIQPTQVLSTTGTAAATMGGVEEGATFRTNLGLCEVWGESAVVRVTVMDSSMIELGYRDYQLRPYENLQVNEVATTVTGAGSLVNGMVRVTVTAGSGHVGAYLSVVDNATGDPTFIAIAPQSPAGQ